MDFPLYFRSRQGEMIALLKKMTALESPTDDKSAVDACAAFVAGEFKKAGGKVSILPQKDIGDFVCVECAPGRARDAEDEILVLTHIDTVWPVGKIVKMPFYISGDKIFGPGVLDMKGGLTMLLAALAAMRSLNLKTRKRITVFINSSEEMSHRAAHEVIRRLAKKASLVLCLEPAMPGGGLKLERKGRLVARLEAHGKSAHAGTPDKGVNAIEEILSQLQRLRRIRTGETTVNIGLIGGGEKASVVPEQAWAELDIRFWKSRDKERIVSLLKELEPIQRGARIKAVVESSTPPMEITKASARLFNEVREIAAASGVTLKGGRTGGGSDASIAAGMGVPTLDGLGPDGDGIHAESEHLLLSSLTERTALLTRLLTEL